MDVLAIAGAATGVASLGGVVYGFGWWRRGIDDSTKQFRKDIADVKKQLDSANVPEMRTMVQTLWEVYVLDPLKRRPDIAQSHSPLSLTEKALNMIPGQVRDSLDRACLGDGHGELPSGYRAVRILGLDTITQMSLDSGLTVQETIAVLGLYIQTMCPQN